MMKAPSDVGTRAAARSSASSPGKPVARDRAAPDRGRFRGRRKRALDRRGPARRGGGATSCRRRAGSSSCLRRGAARPADRIRGALRRTGSSRTSTIDDREAAKTLDAVARIADAALAAGVRRDDALVAVGGGVVSDVAGFAAAILLRGIAWNAVPTTTGAMADAAIGGKTGVDHAAGKNLLGAFHPPRAVLIDPAAAADASRARLPRRPRRGVQGRLDRATRTWRRARGEPRSDPRASRTPRCSTCSAGAATRQGADRLGGPEGRGPPPAPELRAHARPRVRSRRRLPGFAARRGGGLGIAAALEISRERAGCLASRRRSRSGDAPAPRSFSRAGTRVRHARSVPGPRQEGERGRNRGRPAREYRPGENRRGDAPRGVARRRRRARL